jgi:hypothetical protein
MGSSSRSKSAEMRNRDLPDGGLLPSRLERFAEIAEPGSPLSARLARAMATSPIALEILSEAPHGQPAANILLAAVHFLLLGGVDHPLARHYTSLGGSADANPVPAFADFISRHRDQLIEIVSTRTVQTNEVRRCVALRPAIAHATIGADRIALIEIGPSAGLNLLLERYGYDYGEGLSTGLDDADLVLRTSRKHGHPPLELPPIVWRCGIDLQPLDVTDDDDMRWARALLWPEQTDRRQRFDAAVSIARADPPTLVAGDASETIGALLERAPGDARLVVFHSFALNQFTDAQRGRLHDGLASSSRIVDRIGVEMLSRGADAPEILHTRYEAGARPGRTLGTAHHHGEWISWRP